MSTVKTYLTLIFQYNEEWTAAQELATFHEEDATHYLAEVGLPPLPDRKETHFKFELHAPLTESQLDRVRWLKEQGICHGFYVQDEIIADIPMHEVEVEPMHIEQEKPTVREMTQKFREMVDNLKDYGHEDETSHE